MATRSTFGLMRHARLTRRQIIGFALASAILNGIITASVGAWLGQTYAKFQWRRQAIEQLVQLIYERRTRAGLVASAIRRGTDQDELRYRKRAYDQAYVDWNKNVMQNIFAIREVTGEYMISGLEKYYEDGLIAGMADLDRCLTKAYDVSLAKGDGNAVLVACNMAELHQFVLDCGATFTNELYKLTKLSFLPFYTESRLQGREVSEKRVADNCTRKPTVTDAPAVSAAPATPAEPRSPAPPTTAAQPTPIGR